MVPWHKDLVAFKSWRTPLTKSVTSVHLSKVITLPGKLTIHGVAVKPARTEVRINMLTIRAR